MESTRNSLNLSEEPAELGEVACGTRGSRGACGACVEVDLEQGLASMELSTVWISEITFERAVREVVQVSSWQV